MLRKIFLTGALLVSLSLTASAEKWIPMGQIEETGTVTEVSMDGNIQPVAKSENGKAVIIPGLFVSRYQMVINGGEPLKMGSVVDMKSQKTLSFMDGEKAEWLSDKEGADGLLFNAYLIQNRSTILDRKPFIIKAKFIPKDRKPDWEVDANGWQKVYEQQNGSEAWVQTKSAQLSLAEGEDLPLLRVLVRRSDVIGDRTSVTYSYEIYDPFKRTRKPVKVWNADQKPLLFMTKDPYPVPVLSKDAAIGTVGYAFFVLNRPEIEKRGFFRMDDDISNLPVEWFTFTQ